MVVVKECPPIHYIQLLCAEYVSKHEVFDFFMSNGIPKDLKFHLSLEV